VHNRAYTLKAALLAPASSTPTAHKREVNFRLLLYINLG